MIQYYVGKNLSTAERKSDCYMIKTLAKSIREYKKPTILTLIFIIGEAIIETLIPFITGTYLINVIQREGENVDVSYIVVIGLILALGAIISLAFAGLAGITCARASAGFARNLRRDLFGKIQTFSFSNIDRFSSSSLVTRMTTDVNNVQMSFMMLIRTAVRSPLMLGFSIAMAVFAGGWLAATFVVVIPVLTVGLLLVARYAMPAFRSVFKKYDWR